MDRKEFEVNETVRQRKDFYKKLGYSRIDSLLLALDEKFDGNKLYDWYWWHIWSNIKIPYNKIKKQLNEKRYKKQRIKNTLSERDAWYLNNHLLDVLYNGLTKYYMKGEFGNDWRNQSFVKKLDKEKSWCQTHNKKFYKDTLNYIDLYEKYERVLLSDKSSIDDVYKIETKLYDNFSKYISKYLNILWW